MFSNEYFWLVFWKSLDMPVFELSCTAFDSHSRKTA